MNSGMTGTKLLIVAEKYSHWRKWQKLKPKSDACKSCTTKHAELKTRFYQKHASTIKDTSAKSVVL